MSDWMNKWVNRWKNERVNGRLSDTKPDTHSHCGWEVDRGKLRLLQRDIRHKSSISKLQKGGNAALRSQAHGLGQSHTQAATIILRYGLLFKYSTFSTQAADDVEFVIDSAKSNGDPAYRRHLTRHEKREKAWWRWVRVWVQIESEEWAMSHNSNKWIQ